MNNIIPIVHCFDNNYVVPAAVAFYSLLVNSNRNFEYRLYVLHSDITEENQKKLTDMVSSTASNASLAFIDMKDTFLYLFDETKTKGHYSKEIYYKFSIPSLFPQYDKIMISDVDIVWLNDVSKNFVDFSIDENFYLAACSIFSPNNSWVKGATIEAYKKKFSDEEITLLKHGAGYYIYNLDKMRKNAIEEKLIDFAIKNAHRIRQPEQDTISLVCANHIKTLSINSLICTYQYDLYITDDDFKNTEGFSKEEMQYALDNPIQLHYATSIKPWKNLDCTKSHIWYEYLLRTPFFYDAMRGYTPPQKTIRVKLFGVIPFIKIKNNTAYLFNCIKIGKVKIK